MPIVPTRKWPKWAPPANFITLHYVYFITSCLIASVIFYGSSTVAFPVSYVDSLFLIISAMTESGLNTVNLSQINTGQQLLLWLLMVVGSSIWVSIWTVLFRKRAFEHRFKAIVKAERKRALKRREDRRTLSVLERIRSVTKNPVVSPSRDQILGPHMHGAAGSGRGNTTDASREARSSRAEDSVNRDREGPDPHEEQVDGHIAFASAPRAISNTSSHHPEDRLCRRTRRSLSAAEKDAPEDENHDEVWSWRHILTKQNVGPNAQFYNLSRAERERLGGCEYQALKVLAVVVPLYGFLWQVLGAIGIGAWIAKNSPEASTSNGVNPWWAGTFYAISAFNNNGMSLIDLNMIPFQQAYYVLITMGLLILAGNTAYPLFLRLIIWTMWKSLELFTKEHAFCDTKSTLEFILKYPRRVYTNLFPSRPTWWLFFMVILLNGTDWVLFEVLNIGNPSIEKIPLGPRILDGLFQAIAVRSGGFYVIPISAAYPGLQVLYTIMMYISVYPVVITMRHSNVYEERSLGIYADDPRRQNTEPPEAHSLLDNASTALKKTFSFQGVGVPVTPKDQTQGRINFISQQIRSQLAHDLSWLALAVLIITISETKHFLQDPVTFNVFNVMFEVVSAYGTVGISVGLPDQNYSFSGAWNTGSKLVLCLVMLRGRHRGLPVALDRAIRLPSEKLLRDEEEDHRMRARKRSASRASV
ncbi:cation transport protein-domain-containing protein [Podospora aff. communis PSN243]|uniref:Cation transport protein-domain-containing protein n=1 Tax=Podospora aff. communis PSN243 TaxID=3040156 RepID=A0AAV9G441_9PEZI|nr:cation transport protein-domain-containing protein [Podospora aff. communis PSN243]